MFTRAGIALLAEWFSRRRPRTALCIGLCVGVMGASYVQAQVVVTISPTTVSVTENTTKQFTPSVTGTTNVGVKWSVDGVIGGAAANGTISTTGIYTAPATTGAHTVTATSNADTTQSASAAVTVTAVAIIISPTTASVTAGTPKQFIPSVTGTTNVGVKWFVDGVLGGSTASGAVTTGGLYTAPSVAGTHTVSVTANADLTKTASAAVTITTIGIFISPTSASVNTGSSKQFIPSVTGTTNTGVKWLVDNVLGGSTASGTITTGGLYTAPSAVGTHTVSITANADPTKSASAAVTVTAPTPVAITLSPTTATVVGTQTKQFIPTVTGTSNIGVKWFVDGVLGGNSTVGTITTAGLFIPVNLAGVHSIMAVANADTTKSATSTATVTGDISVELTPSGACVAFGGTQQYTATVAGATNQAVNWQVDAIAGGSGTVGLINASGLYTAPSTVASHTIKAISQASTSKTQSVTISVSNTASVAVTPASVQVPVAQTIPFTAKVCGATNTGATWFVDNIAGGNATVGSISATGNYTAPATAGVHTIKAVSAANNAKSGTATVTVASGVVADFGNRTAATFAIPPDMMAFNLTNLTDSKGMGLLTQAGLTQTRVYSNIQSIWTTSKTNPDWTKIDPTISRLQTAGIQPMLQIAYTPSFLVPVVTGCTQNFKMPPSDFATYASLAAQIVAHMDQTFPGFVVDYEIWNEPDLASFCVNPATDAQRLSVYLSIYAATSQAMKAQAAADGKTIRIGGPTVINNYATWVPALLSNVNTAPNVDFVSYHQYPTGTTQIQAGMTWDTPNGTQTLYSVTQSPSIGFLQRFDAIAMLVHAGTQPNAATTPIYVSEYNDGFSFLHDCCRNDPTYAPILNGLMIIDFMNGVYAGAGAVPGRLYYYSGSAFPYFCLIGVWDSLMTCQYPAGGTPVPYPSYHPYNLIGSSSYLGLQSGGNMAVSVSPGATQNGLAATAFYTASKDVIAIVNPTSTSYVGVSVAFNNAGLVPTQGTYYRIDGPGNTIVTVPVTLAPSATGFNTSVDIPPYSMVAVAIQ
jgi:hypothetical protein